MSSNFQKQTSKIEQNMLPQSITISPHALYWKQRWMQSKAKQFLNWKGIVHNAKATVTNKNHRHDYSKSVAKTSIWIINACKRPTITHIRSEITVLDERKMASRNSKSLETFFFQIQNMALFAVYHVVRCTSINIQSQDDVDANNLITLCVRCACLIWTIQISFLFLFSIIFQIQHAANIVDSHI